MDTVDTDQEAAARYVESVSADMTLGQVYEANEEAGIVWDKAYAAWKRDKTPFRWTEFKRVECLLFQWEIKLRKRTLDFKRKHGVVI